MTQARIFDARPCALGEGPLWHPVRQQLFWFDITGHRLLSRDADGPLQWDLGECVSAAGWIDDATLLIASETGLRRFDIATGTHEPLHPVEADDPATRSNDGRADPWGGFWIGTMGKAAEPGCGALYRFIGGMLERLFDGLTIPNAICFAPDRSCAYFCDTPTKRILRQPLDRDGWPDGPPEPFVDLEPGGPGPDGAVTDSEGGIWNAQWGAGHVARYDASGRYDRAIAVPGRHTSCPAFGGADLSTLYCTTAREGIADPDADQGRVYAADAGIRGLPEPQVRL